jgi:hypothetical protein
VGREKGDGREDGRRPGHLLLFAHEWSGEGDGMGQQEVRTLYGLREVFVGLSHAWEQELLEQVLGSPLGVHDVTHRVGIVGVDVGADRPEPDPLAFDVGAVELGGGYHRAIAPLLQPEGKANAGVYVPERAEGGDNDTLTHRTSPLRTPPDCDKNGGAGARTGELGSSCLGTSRLRRRGLGPAG